MATKMWQVTCTQIHNGTMLIEADSADEACAIAQGRLDECEFEFGESTVDYAEEVQDKK